LDAPYRITNVVIIVITKHIALEYGDKNALSYRLVLVPISTEATFSSMTQTKRKKAAIKNSMKRGGHPREATRIAANLASEGSAFANGNTIVIDGGTVMV
jgi:NAD(P)-dependent dehydrogenase (short-subunit alcohol dehydrogenase family)